MGEMIERELISHADIKNVINDPGFLDKHKDVVLEYLDVFFQGETGFFAPDGRHVSQ